MQVPEEAPAWEDLEVEEAEVEIRGPDMYVRVDGWEFYLGEDNGPCRPSLDPKYDYVRFYQRNRRDKALVVHEIPEDDVTYEITFTVRNVYRQ